MAYDLGQASVTRERLLFVPAAAAAALLGHVLQKWGRIERWGGVASLIRAKIGEDQRSKRVRVGF